MQTHQQSRWTAIPYRLIGAPISAIPTIFTPDALPDTTLPIYPGLGQAPNMLACIPGGLVKRYKDQLCVNFKSCNLDHMKWETLAEDRSAWREECHNAVNAFEEQRINAAKVRCAARKDRGHSVSSTSTIHTCDMCGQTCSSHIGLFSHKRSHR